MVYLETENIHIDDGTVITLGNFDGLHRGHMGLINKVLEKKNQLGLKGVMFSFYPHPAAVLRGMEVKIILDKKEKFFVVNNTGLDYFIEYPFNKKFARLDAYDFIKEILVGRLNCKAIVVGEQYRFGDQQSGNVAKMVEVNETLGIETIVMPLLLKDGVKISSSNIRDLITKGKIEQANDLLGRHYFLKGKVERGKMLGRKLGFPTMNVLPSLEKLLPPNGVYITKTVIRDESYYSITNVGNNVTFGYEPIKAETFARGLNSDVNGETIEVYFEKMIRKERKFANAQELTKQIQSDVLTMEKYFGLE